jgi:hypothetical protein
MLIPRPRSPTDCVQDLRIKKRPWTNKGDEEPLMSMMMMMITIIIQFNSIYLCAKLNSPGANYKVSTGKKMGRVRRKQVKTMY